jgi:hypothetical protein
MARRTLSSVQEMPDPTKVQERRENDPPKDKLGFSERQSLEREIEMIERSINQNLNHEKDDPRVLKQLYQKKLLLAKDDDVTFGGDSKDLAYAELKAIEQRIVPHMPTKNEMWPKNDVSAKAQALRHVQEFEKKYMPDVLRWQELKRRLEPENPHAQNLDNIRPD